MRIDKPWGYENIFAKTDKFAGKIIYVKQGKRLSLQYHNIKEECLFIYSGMARIELGNRKFAVCPGESFRVIPRMVHRIEALNDCIIFEVSTPELDDVVRISDDYGRLERKENAENIS